MKRAVSIEDNAALAKELSNLSSLDRPALQERWRAAYGNYPPVRCSRQLLIRAVAYKLQEKVLGGLKPATRRLLLQAPKGPSGRITAPGMSRIARPGTVLVREWQGVSHQVTVLEDGVLFRGNRHKSLSEVARLITGSRWSGPLFFGLKVKPKAQARE